MATVYKSYRLVGDADQKVQVRAEGAADARRGVRPAAGADRGSRRAAAAAEEVSRGDSARVEAARSAAQQEGEGRRLLSQPRSVAGDAGAGDSNSRRAA